jgi:hypothetical protein
MSAGMADGAEGFLGIGLEKELQHADGDSSLEYR